MEESFELLSSMSPKINKMPISIFRPPTILALRKNIRKSLTINQRPQNDTIVEIESSSGTDSDSNPKTINENPIIISSDSSEPEEPQRNYLSKNKFKEIQTWVNLVHNNEATRKSGFNEMSTICGDENNPNFLAPGTQIAVSSTFQDIASLRFDELFKRDLKTSPIDEKSEISDSFEKKQRGSDDFSSDSFEDLCINKSLKTRLKNKDKDKNDEIEDSFENRKNDLNGKLSQSFEDFSNNLQTPKNGFAQSDELEDLLDSLYGDSWRQSKQKVLPQTEPKPRTKFVNINNFVNTERRSKNRNLRRYRISPESEFSDFKTSNLQKNKLNFDSDSENINSDIYPNNNNSISSDEELIKPTRNLRILTDSFEDNIKKNTKDKKTRRKNRANLIFDNNSSDEGEEAKNSTKPNAKVYSFLESLSGYVPLSNCHPKARIYRSCYKQQKTHLSHYLFKLFNEKIFGNQIPLDTELTWNNRMRGTAGLCYCKKVTRRNGNIERSSRIALSEKVLDSPDRLRDTLVHEMCHAAAWIVNEIHDGHGEFWKFWAQKAMKTFPELPQIKRCHNYEINTKYTYKCVGCGYSVGRHTKSLDVEKKRCGYCMGKFEVLINKTSKKGEVKSVPVTPKKEATGFALFVKENYAQCKSPNLKHGDVMRILGQKFNTLKLVN